MQEFCVDRGMELECFGKGISMASFEVIERRIIKDDQEYDDDIFDTAEDNNEKNSAHGQNELRTAKKVSYKISCFILFQAPFMSAVLLKMKTGGKTLARFEQKQYSKHQQDSKSAVL